MVKKYLGFHKDCVNFFHGDEGDDIAEAIKTTYEKYQMKVSLFNMLENVKTSNKCAQVLFLTPEVHSKILEGKLSHLLSKFEDSTHLILLYHHSIDVENEATRQELENKLPKKNSWRFVPLGKDNYEFKAALLDILKIIDPPEIFPVLKQFTLVPSSIWNVSIN